MNPKFHSQTKNVDIKYHMLTEKIENHILQIDYISTNANVVDIFTKALTPKKFKWLHA